MKTTIEIADDLLARARRVATRERKTLRQLVEEGFGSGWHARKPPSRSG